MSTLDLAATVLAAWLGLALLAGAAFTLAASYYGRRGRRDARKRAAQQERLAQVVLFPRREVRGVVRNPSERWFPADGYSPLELRVADELDRGGPTLAARVQALLSERLP